MKVVPRFDCCRAVIAIGATYALDATWQRRAEQAFVSAGEAVSAFPTMAPRTTRSARIGTRPRSICSAHQIRAHIRRPFAIYRRRILDKINPVCRHQLGKTDEQSCICNY